MVRRSAAPKASAPVRSRAPAPSPPARASPPPSYSAPPRPAAAAAPAAAAPAAQIPPPAAAASQGPGLFGQMAATAGGVAIGSAVGHAVGNMFSGGSSSHAEPAPQAVAAPAPAYAPSGQQQMNVCEVEWRQLMECTQRQNDLASCQAFQDIFKDCKTRAGAY